MSFETLEEVIVNVSELTQVRVTRKESSSAGKGVEIRKWYNFPSNGEWRPSPKGIFIAEKIFWRDVMPILKRYEESIRKL